MKTKEDKMIKINIIDYKNKIEEIEKRSDWDFSDTCSPYQRYADLLKAFEDLLDLSKLIAKDYSKIAKAEQKFMDSFFKNLKFQDQKKI